MFDGSHRDIENIRIQEYKMPVNHCQYRLRRDRKGWRKEDKIDAGMGDTLMSMRL